MDPLIRPRHRFLRIVHIVRTVLVILASFQAVSTVIGWVILWFLPGMLEPVLAGTPFADGTFLAGVLLGVVTGGFQWAALYVTWRHPRWFALAHLAAGVSMVCWIFGECLVLDSFIWMHALWGGVGVLQMALVAVHLGALRPAAPQPLVPVPGRG